MSDSRKFDTIPIEAPPQAGRRASNLGHAAFVETAPPDPLGRMRRGLLVGAGILAVGIGIVGVFVPVLPTTPFLLLAAACFVRSSERLYRWLLGNRLFGRYIQRYREGAGVPLASKVVTLALLWATLAASAFLAVPSRLWWVRLLLLAVGIGVTIHVARIKAARRPR